MPIHQLRSANGDLLNDSMLALAMGTIPGVTHVNKFGTNESIGTTYEMVWDQGGVWVGLAAPTLLTLASDDANDDVGDTGAHSVVIEGIGVDGLELTDTVQLNGLTPVTSNLVFSFVNRMYVYAAGSSQTNEGRISASDDTQTYTAGVPDTSALIQSTISILHGQTQQMIFKVPADKWAFTTGGYISADSSKITTYRFFIVVPDSNVIRVAFEGTCTSGDTQLKLDAYFGPIPPGTIVFCDAKTDVGTGSVSAGLDFVLVESKYMQ